MAASPYEQNDDFFVRMFSDPHMMKQVTDSIGTVLYELLKEDNNYMVSNPQLGMVAEDYAPYV